MIAESSSIEHRTKTDQRENFKRLESGLIFVNFQTVKNITSRMEVLFWGAGCGRENFVFNKQGFFRCHIHSNACN